VLFAIQRPIRNFSLTYTKAEKRKNLKRKSEKVLFKLRGIDPLKVQHQRTPCGLRVASEINASDFLPNTLKKSGRISGMTRKLCR
jgi:hypothetical protein